MDSGEAASPAVGWALWGGKGATQPQRASCCGGVGVGAAAGLWGGPAAAERLRKEGQKEGEWDETATAGRQGRAGPEGRAWCGFAALEEVALTVVALLLGPCRLARARLTPLLSVSFP